MGLELVNSCHVKSDKILLKTECYIPPNLNCCSGSTSVFVESFVNNRVEVHLPEEVVLVERVFTVWKGVRGGNRWFCRPELVGDTSVGVVPGRGGGGEWTVICPKEPPALIWLVGTVQKVFIYTETLVWV